MPKKYIGLDVLEYERDLIKLQISDYEMTIFEIPEYSWYTEEEKKEHIKQYESFISRENTKLQAVNDVIDKYYHGFYTETSYSSTEPLQEFYHKEINRLIDRFKKEIKEYYRGLSNTLTFIGPISITYFSEVNAKKITLYYGIKSIITEYLLKEQISEINRLMLLKKEYVKAIEHKYGFFKDSLVDCFDLIQYARNL